MELRGTASAASSFRDKAVAQNTIVPNQTLLHTTPTTYKFPTICSLLTINIEELIESSWRVATSNALVGVSPTAYFEHTDGEAAATDIQARGKKSKTKSPKDATEQSAPSERSETLLEAADPDVDEFEDDPSVWK